MELLKGSFFALGGVASEGRVRLADGRGAVGVVGSMDGTIETHRYAYVYVDGDVGGTLNVNSYATVCVKGDITGTLRVRSYIDLLLKG